MLRQDSQELSLFNGLTNHQIEILGTAFESCDFPRDSRVFEQGEHSDFLYILTSGKVIIRYKPYDGPPLTVATIGPGGVFGWSAALGRSVYSSGALVVENGFGYRISKARLTELCEESPETSALLLKQLANVVSNKVDPAYAEVLKILEHGVIQDCGNHKRT